MSESENKNKLKGCFSHESDHWRTPSEMYKKYMNEGYIDPCPFHADFDGLKIDYFKKKLFINPPYSQMKIWVDYAINQFIRGGCKIVLLIPARTDTQYFHKLLQYSPEIVFIKGRLRFNDSNQSAPFPSILVILERGCKNAILSKGSYGIWKVE